MHITWDSVVPFPGGQMQSHFTLSILYVARVLRTLLGYLEPVDIQALSCTCRNYRTELIDSFDIHWPRLKGWSTLTEAEARACIEISLLFDDHITPFSLENVANSICKYNIDLTTADHVFRYDLFPLLWFSALFGFEVYYPREWLLRRIDKRRRRNKFLQCLTAPYETLFWNRTLWYFKPMWENVIAEVEEKRSARQATTANGSTSMLEAKEVDSATSTRVTKMCNLSEI
ncbi:hypothetical protein K503DRAFT_769511 [Rhizopogon vinicolor AM-OR11-026]|uniref:DUF7079 domain-containing protein n=1 Tax=Rhizopogon vinicolor AM-OR11-026 TaxID=1314800 RepID=A0A1B7N3J2_9AGAM|nr:hypothetical protein K503DRAFT_769511 [Rhizopogon vinicolor AM-OR11-026]